MYLFNLHVDKNNLTVHYCESDFTGRIISHLQKKNLKISYYKSADITVESLHRFIHSLNNEYIILNVNSDNFTYIMELLTLLNNGICTVKIIIVGRYVNNHFEDFFEFENLTCFCFLFLQENHIFELLKNYPLSTISGLIFKRENILIVNNKSQEKNLYEATITDSVYIDGIVSPDTVLKEGYFFSHGCRNNCKFCCIPDLIGRTVFKPIAVIEKELSFFNDYFITKNIEARIEVMDEDFFTDINFTTEICKLIEKNQYGNLYFTVQTRIEQINKSNLSLLRKMNVKEISVGIESIQYKKINFFKSLRISKKEYLKKLLMIIKCSHSNALIIGVNFIFGLPFESVLDLILILSFVFLLWKCDININYLNLQRNSEFGRNRNKYFSNSVKSDKNENKYNIFFKILRLRNITYKQLFFKKLTLYLFLHVKQKLETGFFDKNTSLLFFETKTPAEIYFSENKFRIPYLTKKNKHIINLSFYNLLNKYKVNIRKLHKLNFVRADFCIFASQKRIQNAIIINLNKKIFTVVQNNIPSTLSEKDLIQKKNSKLYIWTG